MKKTFIIGYPKGGVGKSILTWNLAIAIQQQNIKVRVADIDFQQTTFFANKLRAVTDKELLNIESIHDIQDLEEFLNADFDGITFIDIGGYDTELNRLALQSADNILIPYSSDPTEIIGLLTFGKIIEQLEIDMSKIKVFLNQIHSNTKKIEIIKEKISKSYPFFLNSIIRRNNDIKLSIGNGLGVVELTKKNNKAKLQIEDLANEIINLKG